VRFNQCDSWKKKCAKGKTALKNHNLSWVEYAALETKHSLFGLSVMAS